MPVLIVYILKLSISLVVVYLFYYCVLRKLTFYAWNRWYLLGYSFLSFFIASFNITPLLHDGAQYNGPMDDLPAINFYDRDILPGKSLSAINSDWNAWDWCLFIVLAGTAVMFIRLIIQYVSFCNIRRKAQLISANETKIYHVEADIIPFSFGNSIFINRQLHSLEELQEIVRHEFIHVKQRHSIDILWSELLCIICWYNPFTWLLKNSIRQNLEFIADNKVLESGTNKKDYQYLLLRVIGNNHFSIASKFNFSSLKKRIAMMNKMKSAQVHIVKFLFIVPLVAVLLIAFRKKEHRSHASGPQVSSLPQEVKSPSVNVVYNNDTIPKEKSDRKEMDDRKVDNFEITDKKAVMHLKNGKTEEYDITDSLQRRSFETKYGKIISLIDETGPVATVVSPGVATIGLTQQNVAVATAPVAVIANGETVSVAGLTTTVSGSANPVIASTSPTRMVTVVEDARPVIADEDVLVIITQKTTELQLEELKKQAKEKGYELRVDKTTYSNNGALKHVTGSIKSKDGQTGNFSATDFERIILARIKKDNRNYFRIDIVAKKKQVI